MSSGKVHDKITLCLTPITYGITAHYFPPLAPYAALGCAAGLFLSPDLDTISRPTNRWGPLKIFWWLYRDSIPHRSFISHSPILSTLIRVGYLLGGVGAIALLAGINIVPLLMPYRLELLAAVVGLMIADIGHLVADGIPLGGRL